MAKAKTGKADLKKLEAAVEAMMRADEFVVATIEHADVDHPKDRIRTFAGWDTDDNCMRMMEQLLDDNREIIRIIQGDPRAEKEEPEDDS